MIVRLHIDSYEKTRFLVECRKGKKCSLIMIIRYRVKLIKKYFLWKFQAIWMMLVELGGKEYQKKNQKLSFPYNFS